MDVRGLYILGLGTEQGLNVLAHNTEIEVIFFNYFKDRIWVKSHIWIRAHIKQCRNPSNVLKKLVKLSVAKKYQSVPFGFKM